MLPVPTPPGWDRRTRGLRARTQPQLGILPATVPIRTDGSAPRRGARYPTRGSGYPTRRLEAGAPSLGSPRRSPPPTPPCWERRRPSHRARTRPELGILPATVLLCTDGLGTTSGRPVPGPRLRLPYPPTTLSSLFFLLSSWNRERRKPSLRARTQPRSGILPATVPIRTDGLGTTPGCPVPRPTTPPTPPTNYSFFSPLPAIVLELGPQQIQAPRPVRHRETHRDSLPRAPCGAAPGGG